MSVERIVPDIKSKHLDASRQFYVDVMGLEVAMDMGFIVTLRSSDNPTAQVSLIRDDGPTVILRGTIDALIHQHDGGIVVLEFKTGSGRPAHQAQLDTYVQAARALFPDSPVRGMLVYPE